MFPSEVDTQAGVNALERAKTWPGWRNLLTKAEVRKNRDGKITIDRVTIVMPCAQWLLGEYGEFLIIDCTFKLTVYVGRYTIVISVIDRYGHVHPVVIADVPGHREEDWLKAFNDAYDMVMLQVKLLPISKLLHKPKTAFLMRDGEGAIALAWRKSKWPQTLESGECCTHGKWNNQKQKMANGQRFGPDRGKVWYGLVFATCYQSFMDRASEIMAMWEAKGDHAGAQHLLKLVKNSRAPLFRWDPYPAPGISSQGSETANQLIKKSPKDGTRRQKLTFLQFARTVVTCEGGLCVSPATCLCTCNL